VEELFSIDCSGAFLSGLNAYILRHGDDLVVSIRGSQELIDWFQNARARKKRYERVWVHRGFADSARSFINTFEDQSDSWGPFNRIWFTGHSMGGAVAQLVAYVLTKRDYEIATVMTFGSPRVGGPLTWVRRVGRIGLDEKIVRWVNNGDLVTRIPALVPSLNPADKFWTHIGPQNYIDTDDDIVHLGDNRILIFPVSISDHSLTGFGEDETSGYIRNICWFMPDTSRDVLASGTATSLADSVTHLNRIRGRDHPVTLASFADLYSIPPSIEIIGLHFR